MSRKITKFSITKLLVFQWFCAVEFYILKHWSFTSPGAMFESIPNTPSLGLRYVKYPWAASELWCVIYSCNWVTSLLVCDSIKGNAASLWNLNGAIFIQRHAKILISHYVCLKTHHLRNKRFLSRDKPLESAKYMQEGGVQLYAFSVECRCSRGPVAQNGPRKLGKPFFQHENLVKRCAIEVSIGHP